jgi:hypothetical protein
MPWNPDAPCDRLLCGQTPSHRSRIITRLEWLIGRLLDSGYLGYFDVEMLGPPIPPLVRLSRLWAGCRDSRMEPVERGAGSRKPRTASPLGP